MQEIFSLSGVAQRQRRHSCLYPDTLVIIKMDVAIQLGRGQTKSWTEYRQKGDQWMYSEEQYRKALEVYEKTKSVTKTITILGY